MVYYDNTYALGANQGSSQRTSNQYIILHDTGNDNNQGANSAQNEAAYMRNNWGNAYTHAIAGHDRVLMVGEPGYVAYGAGSPANERSPFQIELAHYSDPALARAAYVNFINAAREFAERYGIPMTLDGSGNGIKTHKWVSDNLWGDHQDPYGYLSRIGISKAQLEADLAKGVSPASTVTPAPSQPSAKPTSQSAIRKVHVFYALRLKNGGWLDEVTDFGSGDNGFAGMPSHQHDLLYIRVDHGSVKYRVHTVQSGWLPWVAKGDCNDTVNGCAGNAGEVIDGVQIIFLTPAGESYQQAYYRSQTTQRSGWLGVVCDGGTSLPQYTDTYAGMFGEPLDRLQIGISSINPF